MKRTLVLILMLLATTCTCVAREIVVLSAADSGRGTLRWALELARPGDVITFDPAIFPPTSPVTIYPRSELPVLWQGHVTIDASNAGAIIDGSRIAGDWTTGITVSSDHNVIMGLQVVSFAGSGIALCTASENIIGGGRELGRGPVGRGNLVSANGIGIDLCDQGTGNVITGNLIGTEADGITPWPNSSQGIWIENRIANTTVGPDNVVCSVRDRVKGSEGAAGSVLGILVSGHQAVGNTITHNVFLGDPFAAIQLVDRANSGLAAPSIIEADLSSGAVQGLSLPLATVEIYSASGTSGRISYEGTAFADETGLFSLHLGRAVAGDIVSSISTDSEGNSSPFSLIVPATGSANLQAGCQNPKTAIQVSTQDVQGNNHIGGGYGGWEWDPSADNSGFYESLLEDIKDLGITWFHTSFESENPLCWQWVLRSPGVHDVPQDVDDFVTALAHMGVNVIISLGTGMGLDRHEYGWDCWGDPGWGALADREPHQRFVTQQERDQYMAYVAFMVAHFKGRVSHYEIWNEPNVRWSPDVCLATILPEDYAALVRDVAPLIHSLDPDASVIAGASALFGPKERAWLLDVLDDGVAELIDGISWHPFFGPGPGDCVGKCPEPGYWETYPDNVAAFKEDAGALGFAGGYYVDELVWRSGLDYVPSEPPIYTEIQAAKLAARANVVHLGLGFEEVSNQLKMPAGILRIPRYYVLKHLCAAARGAESIGMPVVEIDIDYGGPVVYCAFRYPNGDRMLAVWTDGIAQDEDPGVLATIAFPGLAAGSATGIDVLRGFEQELVLETNGEDTIIRDLLVKDYPILIRLSDVTLGPDYEETVGDGFHQMGDISAVPRSTGGSDRDGDGVPDDEDYCPDWPGSAEANGC
jgi:hypothetical protein